MTSNKDVNGCEEGRKERRQGVKVAERESIKSSFTAQLENNAREWRLISCRKSGRNHVSLNLMFFGTKKLFEAKKW